MVGAVCCHEQDCHRMGTSVLWMLRRRQVEDSKSMILLTVQGVQKKMRQGPRCDQLHHDDFV